MLKLIKELLYLSVSLYTEDMVIVVWINLLLEVAYISVMRLGTQVKTAYASILYSFVLIMFSNIIYIIYPEKGLLNS